MVVVHRFWRTSRTIVVSSEEGFFSVSLIHMVWFHSPLNFQIALNCFHTDILTLPNIRSQNSIIHHVHNGFLKIRTQIIGCHFIWNGGQLPDQMAWSLLSSVNHCWKIGHEFSYAMKPEKLHHIENLHIIAASFALAENLKNELSASNIQKGLPLYRMIPWDSVKKEVICFHFLTTVNFLVGSFSHFQ